MRSLLLNTPELALEALDVLVDSKSKKPIKVEKPVLAALLRDHDRMIARLNAEGVSVAHPERITVTNKES